MQVYAIGNPFGLDHTLTQVKHSARMCMAIALSVLRLPMQSSHDALLWFLLALQNVLRCGLLDCLVSQLLTCPVGNTGHCFRAGTRAGNPRLQGRAHQECHPDRCRNQSWQLWRCPPEQQGPPHRHQHCHCRSHRWEVLPHAHKLYTLNVCLCALIHCCAGMMPYVHPQDAALAPSLWLL
jgi:hypothetical protein